MNKNQSLKTQFDNLIKNNQDINFVQLDGEVDINSKKKTYRYSHIEVSCLENRGVVDGLNDLIQRLIVKQR